MSRTIALLTDFGVTDSYVGVMKGVMRRINPTAGFIDITHLIEPQNVRAAALTLMGAVPYFPAGTVFLVVVDPGVGTARQPIAVETPDYMFVGPDNGVLSYVLQSMDVRRTVTLSNAEFQLPVVSQTFHGRDIFAPAAAHLSAGVTLPSLGEAISVLQTFPAPRLVVDDDVIEGEVIYIDHFGNVVTSIGQCRWVESDRLCLEPRFGSQKAVSFMAGQVTVQLGDAPVQGVARTYGAVEPGQVLALIGSGGFLELAVNQGSGAEKLDARIGDRIELRMQDAAISD
ncbi:MAG: hypothetical protein CL610_10055 [Anaerolineaceae bacterium]|nr:hypothetical protein [Anaerolineaceae bacterium]